MRASLYTLFCLAALLGGSATAATTPVVGSDDEPTEVAALPVDPAGDELFGESDPTVEADDGPELVAGYFTGARPRQSPVPVVAGPRLMVRPMQVGLMMTIGSHIPIAGNTHLIDGRREFTPTLDFGGSLFFNIQRLMQVDLVARGGFGGVSAELYEDRYRIPGLESRHIWLGSTFRVFPFDAWGIQPYVSASIGGDRVLAVRREPNGSYECTTDGWVTECDPELERVFAAGYWGASLGYGGGIRIEPGRNGRLSFFLDVQHLFNRYGRRTSSQTGPDRLGTSAPRTQVITANVGVAFGF
jgi:hypothetical protein